jgi:O-antigen/teichoic acid export membrane protein
MALARVETPGVSSVLLDEPTLTTVAAETETPAAPQQASIGDSVIRGALAMLSTQPITWAASLLAAAFVPRLLGAQSLGQLSFAMSVAAIVGTAFGFGIPDYLTRRIAQRSAGEHRLNDTILGFYVHTASSTVGVVLVGIGSLFVPASVVDVPLLFIAFISVLTAPAQAALLSFFRGREKHAWYAWANAGQVAMATVGGVLALIAGADVRIYALIGAIFSTLSTLLCWKLASFWPTPPHLSAGLLREGWQYIRGGLPFGVWNLTLTVYGMGDMVLMGMLANSTETGWYSAALRIVGVTVFIPTIIVTPLFPAVSRNVGNPEVLRRAIAQTLRLSLFMTIPLGAGILAVAPRVPSLLGWSDEFSNTIPLMQILALHIPAVAIDMVLGTILLAVGRERQWVRVGIIAAIVNLGGNIFAIPLAHQLVGDGALGASITKVVTEGLMFVGALVVLPRHLVDPKIALYAVRLTIAGVACALAATALLWVGIHLAVVAGAVAYFATAFVLRGIEVDDLLYILRRFTKRTQVAAAS